MASVYILYSKQLDSFYVGSCADLNQRLIEHRDKKYKNSYTAKADDWELFFSLNDLGYEAAREIEKHIKKMKSRKYVNDLKNYPDISSKLIELYP